ILIFDEGLSDVNAMVHTVCHLSLEVMGKEGLRFELGVIHIVCESLVERSNGGFINSSRSVDISAQRVQRLFIKFDVLCQLRRALGDKLQKRIDLFANKLEGGEFLARKHSL